MAKFKLTWADLFGRTVISVVEADTAELAKDKLYWWAPIFLREPEEVPEDQATEQIAAPANV